MKKIFVAYFKNFGINNFNRAKEIFERKHSGVEVELKALGQEQTINAVENETVDFAITSVRDADVGHLFIKCLANVSLVAVFQSGNFDRGQQTIELHALDDVPDLLVASTEEESAELHYQRNLLGIKSPFLAIDSFNEAALMAESGSGYFIVDEKTAPFFTSQQLQKMFLLKNGCQLRQDYTILTKRENKADSAFLEFSQILNKELN